MEKDAQSKSPQTSVKKQFLAAFVGKLNFINEITEKKTSKLFHHFFLIL